MKLLAIFHFVFAGLAFVGIGFLCVHYAIMHTVFANTGVQILCVPLRGGGREPGGKQEDGWQGRAESRFGKPHTCPFNGERWVRVSFLLPPPQHTSRSQPQYTHRPLRRYYPGVKELLRENTGAARIIRI